MNLDEQSRPLRISRARELIEYPTMRAEVLGAVERLSDRDHQERVWIQHLLPHPDYYDERKLEIHILFDDIPVCITDDDYWVGSVLFPAEVAPLYALGRAFEAMIDDPQLVGDAGYLGDLRWDTVLESARVAVETMRANDDLHPDVYLGMDQADQSREDG